MNASGGSTGAPVSRYTKPVNETPWKRGQDPAGYRGDAPQSRPAPTFGNIRNAHELCAVMSEIEPPDGYGRKWHDLETPDRDPRVYREDPDDIVVASASGKIPDPVGSVAYKIRTLGGGTDAYAAHGEPLGEVDADGNADGWRIWVDMTKASRGHRHEIVDVGEILRKGSPVRKTDRAGYGTAGTRLVQPVGYEPIIVAYSGHSRIR